MKKKVHKTIEKMRKNKYLRSFLLNILNNL